jgi:hypothetical protein
MPGVSRPVRKCYFSMPKVLDASGLLYPTDILSVQIPMWVTFELLEMKKKAGVNTLG